MITWSSNPRVRVDTLRTGATGIAIDGKRYRFDRKDGALSGAYHATCLDDGSRTTFAGCAEWVPL